MRAAERSCRKAAGASVRLQYRGLDDVLRLTQIQFDCVPQERSAGHCRFAVTLGPKESQTLEVTVACFSPRNAQECRRLRRGF